MLWAGFILGLLGSLHCIGMCGPIAFMLPVDRNNQSKKIYQISIYHLGRLLAYSSIGVLFGILGKSFQIFGWQQQLSIIIGVLMIVIVLLPHKQIQSNIITKFLYRIIAKVKQSLGAALKRKNTSTFFTIGLLNGFLPCGLVYMAALAAIGTADLFHSSAFMVLFGLGTVPVMTSAIYVGKLISPKRKQQLQKLIPVMVIVIGTLFIIRGLGLGIPYLSPSISEGIVSGQLNCH